MDDRLPGSERAPEPETSSAPRAAGTESISRIRLALLEELAVSQERRGYDPYDTHTSGVRDVWSRTSRRRA
ncbi:MAG TPA: hypothetical protein VLW26_07325 [Steroidobacteraceae bacterium]|nr:hypothetical protein [Steroidobacteraceae bacterium]